MRIDMIQNGRVLRTIDHEGQTFVEVPSRGTYTLRVSNNHYKRRLVVISVDGVNVVSGEPASHNGGGYVLDPWQIIEIPGYRRDNGEVAAFEFTEQGGSYAAQTGKGTSNVGVIGMAVFNEYVEVKVPEPPKVVHHHHHWPKGVMGWGGPIPGMEVTSNTAQDDEPIPCAAPAGGLAHAQSGWGEPEPEPLPISEQGLSARLAAYKKGEYTPGEGAAPSARMDAFDLGREFEARERSTGRTRHYSRRARPTKRVKDVGTGYGRRVKFRTAETKFRRASETPNTVVVLRYATRGRLESWGVPVEPLIPKGPTAANPFPGQPSVAAPPGWRG